MRVSGTKKLLRFLLHSWKSKVSATFNRCTAVDNSHKFVPIAKHFCAHRLNLIDRFSGLPRSTIGVLARHPSSIGNSYSSRKASMYCFAAGN